MLYHAVRLQQPCMSKESGWSMRLVRYLLPGQMQLLPAVAECSDWLPVFTENGCISLRLWQQWLACV